MYEVKSTVNEDITPHSLHKNLNFETQKLQGIPWSNIVKAQVCLFIFIITELPLFAPRLLLIYRNME